MVVAMPEYLPGWFRPQGAAEYSGVSKRTVHDWLTSGLPFSRVGRCVLIKRDDLDQFIEKHSVESQSQTLDKIASQAVREMGL